jgi:glycosyltransferase involved in cell wall biosynthesis
MKILHCVEFYYPHIGGAEKHVLILSKYFSNLGNEAHVATSKIYNRKNKILNNVKFGYCNNNLNNITNKLDSYISNNYHKNKIIKKKY